MDGTCYKIGRSKYSERIMKWEAVWIETIVTISTTMEDQVSKDRNVLGYYDVDGVDSGPNRLEKDNPGGQDPPRGCGGREEVSK